MTSPNAGSRYAEFRRQTSDLDELDWSAIAARYFTDPVVMEAKQAEFLVYEAIPFGLFDRIGVISQPMVERAEAALAALPRRPAVEIRANWYY